MDTIKEALTFDDVLLLPKYSNILPSNTNIIFRFSRRARRRPQYISSVQFPYASTSGVRRIGARVYGSRFHRKVPNQTTKKAKQIGTSNISQRELIASTMLLIMTLYSPSNLVVVYV